MDRDCDVLVVGGGVIGSCAALSLQQSGKNTLLIDQFHLPHKNGSSGGQARITRLAHYGPRQLTPILEDAMQRWSKISAKVGEELISPAPMLVVGSGTDVVEEMAESLEKAGQRPNWLTIAQTNAKYKSRFPEDFLAFEDEDAGVIRADRCLSAVLKLFRECGGRVEGGWKVEKVEAGDGWVQVRGPRGTLKAQKLLLCPGPWASQVLNPLGIFPPLRPTNTRAYFYENNGFPHASFFESTEPYIYGLPAMDSKGLYKFGVHGGDRVEPGPERRDLSYIGRDRLEPYITKYLPFLKPVGEEECWFTETPDREFIIDCHPDHPNITYACGFSGTGFKAGPTIGHILACEVTGQDHGYDMTPFRAARFTNAKSHIKSKM